MKKAYEVDLEQVKENILVEVNRYIANTQGYSRNLLDYNLIKILEEGYKPVPTDFKE